MLRYAVIGVGINVNHNSFPSELEALATSLRRETGRSWEREQIIIEFLRALENELVLLEAELTGTQPTLAFWTASPQPQAGCGANPSASTRLADILA